MPTIIPHVRYHAHLNSSHELKTITSQQKSYFLKSKSLFHSFKSNDLNHQTQNTFKPERSTSYNTFQYRNASTRKQKELLKRLQENQNQKNQNQVFGGYFSLQHKPQQSKDKTDDDDDGSYEYEYEYEYEVEEEGEYSNLERRVRQSIETSKLEYEKNEIPKNRKESETDESIASSSSSTPDSKKDIESHPNPPKGVVERSFPVTRDRYSVIQNDKKRLDKFLMHELGTELSFAEIQKLIRKGKVYVANSSSSSSTSKRGLKVKNASQRIKFGDTITVRYVPGISKNRPNKSSDFQRPHIRVSHKFAEEIRSWVVYKDDRVLVINKPAGIASQGGRKVPLHIDGLLHVLRFERDEDPRLVHRLDKGTSGCLVLARDRRSAATLAKWFSRRFELKKSYWALVKGKPRPSRGRISMPIRKQKDRDRETSEEMEQVKPVNSRSESRSKDMAITEYKLLDSVAEESSLLVLYPLTGRTHQLRVHCAEALFCPIVGDHKYGTGFLKLFKNAISENLQSNIFLHARSVVLPWKDPKHPQHQIKVTAPLPRHMTELFSFLGISSKQLNADDALATVRTKNIEPSAKRKTFLASRKRSSKPNNRKKRKN